jgi:CheY-like chemotaxis protein
MMRILFVDDEYNRWAEFLQNNENMTGDAIVAEFVMTPEKAIAALSKHQYDLIFLDHDMGDADYLDQGRRGGGQVVADWMAEHLKPEDDERVSDGPTVILHSLNHSGRKRQHHTLGRYFEVEELPFAWRTVRIGRDRRITIESP